jgi:hypothetical protein
MLGILASKCQLLQIVDKSHLKKLATEKQANIKFCVFLTTLIQRHKNVLREA